MPKPSLRAVKESDRPPASKSTPKTILAAASAGERELLVALRTKAAVELDSGGVPAHAIPTLMKQLRELDKDIRAIDAARSEQQPSDASSTDSTYDTSVI